MGAGAFIFISLTGILNEPHLQTLALPSAALRHRIHTAAYTVSQACAYRLKDYHTERLIYSSTHPSTVGKS